jgi:hypothetical protein
VNEDTSKTAGLSKGSLNGSTANYQYQGCRYIIPPRVNRFTSEMVVLSKGSLDGNNEIEGGLWSIGSKATPMIHIPPRRGHPELEAYAV